MNKDRILNLISIILGIIPWIFPSIPLYQKLIVLGIVVISVLLTLYRERLGFFFRKYWQEVIVIFLLTAGYLIIQNIYPDVILPIGIGVLLSVAISLLIGTKYKTFVYRHREILVRVPINNQWKLNHWGGNSASIVDDKILFKGTTVPNGTDGCHIDLKDLLDVGMNYEVTCFAKSSPNTFGQFMLWCHDNSGEPNKISITTPYKTPSVNGEIIKLNFTSQYNKNIRIHLQYAPGLGQIEVNNIVIYKLT